MHIRTKAARGLVGTASHALGTARAELTAVKARLASLSALVICGIITLAGSALCRLPWRVMR